MTSSQPASPNETRTTSLTTTPTVALVGNPNTGKTSVFNMLTGARHRVGNYPGVTVEKVTGRVTHEGGEFELLDLPGTYSLAARSPDEMIVVDTILSVQPGVDAVAAAIVVVDASNLDRNLFLATQVIETGVPVVVALNMVDVAARNNVRVATDVLAERLGTAVVTVDGHRGRGREQLVRAVVEAIAKPTEPRRFPWPEEFEQTRSELAAGLADLVGVDACPPRYLIRRCLLDIGGYTEQRLSDRFGPEAIALLEQHRERLRARRFNLPSLEAETRYRWIGETVEVCASHGDVRGRRMSERVDSVLTHRLFGSLIFVAIMGSVFVSVFSWAAPLMNAIDGVFTQLGDWVRSSLGEGVLGSFVADGVLGGVGSILQFLPQILILFALISLLEDCGYLARAAFLMDRVMRLFGVGGRSFVPLLSSFACAIPGILSARTVENRRDRLVTVLIAPLMACSARIPVYALLVAVFVPAKKVAGFLPLQGFVFTCLYLFGIIAAAAVAFVLKHTILPGSETPFLLELPSYKVPSLRTVALRLYDRGKDFVVTAGTIILALSVIIWALLYFPRPASIETQVRQHMAQAGETRETTVDNAVAGAYLRQSYLGRVGRAIEPAVKPLGWDWRIGTAALAAFPAREVVISTLGIIYNLGPDEDEHSHALRDKLRAASWPDGGKVLTLPAALSLLAFFALSCQCQATVAVIKRETNSWRWAAFAFAYLTVLGYAAACAVYQIGVRIG